MSNLHFINLLLSTDDKQARALLNSITFDQTNFLSSVIFNLYQVLNLSKEDSKFLRKKGISLVKIGDTKKSKQHRKRLILKHKSLVLKTLHHFKSQLLRDSMQTHL